MSRREGDGEGGGAVGGGGDRECEAAEALVGAVPRIDGLVEFQNFPLHLLGDLHA